MGGSRITKTVEDLIICTCLEMEAQGGKPTAESVNAAVEEKLRQQKKTYLHMPGERKTQMILKKFREGRDKLPPKEKELDQSWSIVTLSKHEIPPSALPAVIRVWKCSLSLEHPLTIRQALWVARLHSMFEDTYYLYVFSATYAGVELTQKALGHSLDSFQIDMHWTHGKWEAQTANWVKHSWEEPIPSGLPVPTIGSTAANFLALVAESDTIKGLDSDQYTEFGVLYNRLPDISSIDLCDEAKVVYGYWLKHLSDGPKWPEFGTESRIKVIQQLRQWVQDHPENILSLANEDEKSHALNELRNRLHDRLPQQVTDDLLLEEFRSATIDLLPEELLDAVGYDINAYSINTQKEEP